MVRLRSSWADSILIGEREWQRVFTRDLSCLILKFKFSQYEENSFI